MSEQEKKRYVETVSHFVIDRFLYGERDGLMEDTSFLEEGIIDSTGILEMVMFLEETYGIKIEDDELVPENMDNLRSIARFLDIKLSARAAAEA